MAETKQVTLKRYNGTDQDTLHPETDWDQVEGKPSTFTPTAHTLNSHTDVNASPTDGQALVWDGTNSLWIAGEGGGGAASVTISETEPSSPSVGDLWWDSTEGNLYIYYDDGSSTQWVQSTSGVSAVINKSDLQSLYIYGKASGAITKGQAVQFAGAQGDHILIKAAVPSEINSNPTYMIGIADSDLSNNDFGYVIINGRLTLNTSTYSAGDILYYDSAGSTAGALTTTEPTGGQAIIEMAAVSVSGVDNGEFVVRTQLLSREIHEVIGLQTALDGKANTSHTHAISDVTGLQSALDAKATPSDITTAINNLVDLAPGSLDTLNELAAALGDDANFAGTVTTALAGKAPLSHTHDDRYYTETEVNTLLAGKQNAGTYNTIIGTDADIDTSGATIIDNLYMTDGVITSHGTRTLTLADLGYTGATNANNYVHPTHPGDDINLDTGPLSGATVISDLDFNITSDTQGHITDANATYSTRNLTAADIGAQPAGSYMTTSHPANNITSTHLYMANGDGFIWNDTTNVMSVRKDGTDYTVWDSGNLTNLNQLSNGPGYVTSSGVTSVATGGGLTGGTITGTGTISHADTSAQGSVNNSGATVIQDVTLDTYGHTTGLGSVTITPALIGAQPAGSYLTTSGKAADSNLLDGIDSSQFLRSDANDTTTGNLTVSSTGSNRATMNLISAGNVPNDFYLGSNGSQHWSLTSRESGNPYLGLYNLSTSNWAWTVATNSVMNFIANPTVNGNTIWNAGNDGSGSGLDADLLDGNHASAFYLASNPNGYTSNTGTVTSVTSGDSYILMGGTSAAPTVNISSTTGSYLVPQMVNLSSTRFTSTSYTTLGSATLTGNRTYKISVYAPYTATYAGTGFAPTFGILFSSTTYITIKGIAHRTTTTSSFNDVIAPIYTAGTLSSQPTGSIASGPYFPTTSSSTYPLAFEVFVGVGPTTPTVYFAGKISSSGGGGGVQLNSGSRMVIERVG